VTRVLAVLLAAVAFSAPVSSTAQVSDNPARPPIGMMDSTKRAPSPGEKKEKSGPVRPQMGSEAKQPLATRPPLGPQK
jgi:hypothetical protein